MTLLPALKFSEKIEKMIFLYLFLIFGIQAETRCHLEAKDKARRKIQMCKNKTNGIKKFYFSKQEFSCKSVTGLKFFFKETLILFLREKN